MALSENEVRPVTFGLKSTLNSERKIHVICYVLRRMNTLFLRSPQSECMCIKSCIFICPLDSRPKFCFRSYCSNTSPNFIRLRGNSLTALRTAYCTNELDVFCVPSTALINLPDVPLPYFSQLKRNQTSC